MHLGLQTGLLCPIMTPGHESPVLLLKFQMAPRFKTLDVLRVQEKGTQNMHVRGQPELQTRTGCGLRFLPLFHNGLLVSPIK